MRKTRINRIAFLFASTMIITLSLTGAAENLPPSGKPPCEEFRNPCETDGFSGFAGPSGFREGDSNQLWKAIVSWKERGNPEPLRAALHVLLVTPEPEAESRAGVIFELSRLNWVVDFTPFEDVFRQCDLKSGFACSELYFRNALVFGDREWKTRVLATALRARDFEGRLAQGRHEFDGFRVRIPPLEAAGYVRDLGLRELYPEVLEAVRMRDSWSATPILSNWEKTLTTSHQFLGTDSGNAHPAEILSDRLTAYRPEEIYNQILDPGADIDSTWVLSTFQRRLRVWCHWWLDAEEDAEKSRVIMSSAYEPLLRVLGRSYRTFLENPPQSVLKSTCDFDAANDRIRLEFIGRYCDGSVDLDDFAFDDPQEAAQARVEIRQRIGISH